MSWRITAELGGVVYTATESDTPGAEVLPPQLISVRASDQLVETELWPAQRDAATASITVALATAADANHITAGSPVVLRYYSPADATTPVYSWHGRASDPTVTPEDYGAAASVTCADYYADLSGVDVLAGSRPFEHVHARLAAAFTEAGIIPPPMPPDPDPLPLYYADVRMTGWEWLPPAIDSRPAGSTDLRELVDDLLASPWGYRFQEPEDGAAWLHDGTAAAYMELRPNFGADGHLDPAQPWLLVARDRGVPAPLALGWQLGATNELVAGPPGDRVVAAAGVDRGVTWTRHPQPTHLVVTGPNGERAARNVPRSDTPQDPRVTLSVELPVRHPHDYWFPFFGTPPGDGSSRQSYWPRAVAEWLYPNSGPRLSTDWPTALARGWYTTDPTGAWSSWAAESFNVALDQLPAGTWPGHLADSVAVVGIAPESNPDGRSWTVGVVVAAELTASDGNANLELRLATGPVTAAPGNVTVDQLPGTIDQLGATVLLDALAFTAPPPIV